MLVRVFRAFQFPFLINAHAVHIAPFNMHRKVRVCSDFDHLTLPDFRIIYIIKLAEQDDFDRGNQLRSLGEELNST